MTDRLSKEQGNELLMEAGIDRRTGNRGQRPAGLPISGQGQRPAGELIMVNEADEITGYGEKIALHKAACLHRAFSIFIFDPESHKMLIQQRAYDKYHSGGKWSNSCCSHPYRGESWEEALCRCMKDELGITAPLRSGKGLCQTKEAAALADACIGPVPLLGPEDLVRPDPARILFTGRFHYLSRYEDLSEHEMDHVFLYLPDRATLLALMPDPAEIAAVRWVGIPELNRWVREEPGHFSTWFLPAYACLRDLIG